MFGGFSHARKKARQGKAEAGGKARGGGTDPLTRLDRGQKLLGRERGSHAGGFFEDFVFFAVRFGLGVALSQLLQPMPPNAPSVKFVPSDLTTHAFPPS
jgi:hypothetical protein